MFFQYGQIIAVEERRRPVDDRAPPTRIVIAKVAGIRHATGDISALEFKCSIGTEFVLTDGPIADSRWRTFMSIPNEHQEAARRVYDESTGAGWDSWEELRWSLQRKPQVVTVKMATGPFAGKPIQCTAGVVNTNPDGSWEVEFIPVENDAGRSKTACPDAPMSKTTK